MLSRLALSRSPGKGFDSVLEQNQSNSAPGKTIEGGGFLRKTPLKGGASVCIYSDSAVTDFADESAIGESHRPS